MMDLNVEQETLRDLSSRKQNLLLELNNYETNQKQSLAGKAGSVGLDGNEMGVIPAQTQLQTALAINLGSEGKPVSQNWAASFVFLTLLVSLFSTRIFRFITGLERRN